MGFIKAGGGDIFNNFSHDRTLGTHIHRDTTHAVAQKVEFYECPNNSKSYIKVVI